MARIKEGLTSVSVARSKTVSLRTTIPAHVAKRLGLTAKDQLDWNLDKVGDKWVAVIEKVEPEA